MSVFKEAKSNRLGWPVPLLKRIFSSAVTMKHKLDKGIILSWDDYAHNTVSDFLLCFMFYVTILLPPNLFRIPHMPPAGSLKVLRAPARRGGIRRAPKTKIYNLETGE